MQRKNKPISDRSANMAAIRSKGNKSTEWRLRLMMVRAGLTGWRVHMSSLTGSPDFAFPDNRVAVFVDGCFWHGCPQCYLRPRKSQNYWDLKFKRNTERDRAVNQALISLGWHPVRIWEHELDFPQETIEFLKTNLSFQEPFKARIQGN